MLSAKKKDAFSALFKLRATSHFQEIFIFEQMVYVPT